MRGRTNVGGGGGISINATVERKTIKSGDIVAGDFVEYYTEPTSIPQSANLSFRFNIGDYIIAVASDNSLVAFKDGQQIASYANYNFNFIQKYNDWIIFCDNSLGFLGILSISDNGFALIDAIETQDIDSSVKRIDISAGSGKICYCKVGKNSNNNYIYKIGIANMSPAGALSNFALSQIRSPENPTNMYMGFVYPYNDSFYIFGGHYLSSSPTWVVKRTYLSISNDNEATIDSQTDCSGIQLSFANNVKEIYRDQTAIAFIVLQDSSNVDTLCHLYILNVLAGTLNELNIPENGMVLSYVDNDGYFLITAKRTKASNRRENYLIRLCRFNTELHEYTILDDLEESCAIAYIHDLLGAICNDIIYVQRRSSSSYDVDLYEIYNEIQLQRIPQKDYVIPYAAGHPIGVAKEGGTTNDIIGVYIPVASS